MCHHDHSGGGGIIGIIYRIQFYLVLKFMRFKAPILRDDASVNNFECNSITRHIRYSRRNIGNDNATSYGTVSVPICLFLLANLVVHWKVYCPGIGCTAHIVSSNVIWHIRCHVIAIRQSSAQLSIINSCNKNKRNWFYYVSVCHFTIEKLKDHLRWKGVFIF